MVRLSVCCWGDRRYSRRTRGNDVVDDNDRLPRFNGVRLHLKRVLSVRYYPHHQKKKISATRNKPQREKRERERGREVEGWFPW